MPGPLAPVLRRWGPLRKKVLLGGGRTNKVTVAKMLAEDSWKPFKPGKGGKGGEGIQWLGRKAAYRSATPVSGLIRWCSQDWGKTRAMVTTAHAHMPFRVWSGILVPSRGWMVVRTETKAVGGAVSPKMARNSRICWSYHPPLWVQPTTPGMRQGGGWRGGHACPHRP